MCFIYKNVKIKHIYLAENLLPYSHLYCILSEEGPKNKKHGIIWLNVRSYKKIQVNFVMLQGI